MGFKEVVDADDVGVLKARQNAGFVQEAFQAPVEIRRRLLRLRHDGQVLFAGSQVRGEILLDRHGNIQRHVPAEVGYAESALAEDAAKLKFPDARSRWQRQAMLLFLTHTRLSLVLSSQQLHLNPTQANKDSPE